MTQYTFIKGNSYSRQAIHDQLGGGLRVYLPSVKLKIVCACIDKELNPNAPQVILVGGKGMKTFKRAETLSRQADSIPVFMKERSKRWRFEGEYVANGLKIDKATIQKEMIGFKRENVVGILYLKKVVK